MNGSVLLAWLALFAGLVLFTYGALFILGNRRQVRKRIDAPEEMRPAILKQEETKNPVLKRLLEWLSSSGKWALKDEAETSRIRGLLINGGFRHPKAPAIFFGIKALVGLLLPVPFLLVCIMHERLNSMNLLLAFLLGGGGYFLPQVILGRMVKARQDRIDKALPDVIDLFIICMEAGLALQAAMNRVAEEIRDVCQDFYNELQITAGEMRAGISRDQALRNLSRRTGVASVRSLTTLITQSDKLGTSIAQALRVHADFIRTERTLKAEERAAKMPVKIMVPLVFFIFPAMFVVVIGPGAIQIMKNLFPALSGGS